MKRTKSFRYSPLNWRSIKWKKRKKEKKHIENSCTATTTTMGRIHFYMNPRQFVACSDQMTAKNGIPSARRTIYNGTRRRNDKTKEATRPVVHIVLAGELTVRTLLLPYAAAKWRTTQKMHFKTDANNDATHQKQYYNLYISPQRAFFSLISGACA